MTENAPPTSTARASLRRAPAMVSAIAESTATVAPIATALKWIQPPKYTLLCPTKCSSAGGTQATNAASASLGTSRSATDAVSARAQSRLSLNEALAQAAAPKR